MCISFFRSDFFVCLWNNHYLIISWLIDSLLNYICVCLLIFWPFIVSMSLVLLKKGYPFLSLQKITRGMDEILGLSLTTKRSSFSLPKTFLVRFASVSLIGPAINFLCGWECFMIARNSLLLIIVPLENVSCQLQ